MLVNFNDPGCEKREAAYDGYGPYKILRQLNEECAELIQASSKLMRIMEGEHRINNAVALDNFHEEIGDVFDCIEVLMTKGYVCAGLVESKANDKLDRWVSRLREQENK